MASTPPTRATRRVSFPYPLRARTRWRACSPERRALRLETRWRGGTTQILMERHELLQRLVPGRTGAAERGGTRGRARTRAVRAIAPFCGGKHGGRGAGSRTEISRSRGDHGDVNGIAPRGGAPGPGDSPWVAAGSRALPASDIGPDPSDIYRTRTVRYGLRRIERETPG